MSVRAYRQITEPKLASAATFNLRDEPELVDALLDLDSTWSTEGNEQMEISVDELERLLETTTFLEETMAALREDIAAARNDRSDVLYYHCY